MSDLARGGATSLTQQLVDRVAHSIDAGSLAPGAKLPTTRALAADAGINHLTAARVYRRLAEMGYVTAAVGRGTFVRRRPPTAAPVEDEDWQLGMLAERPRSRAGELLGEALASVAADDTIALAAGFPDPALCPVDELAAIAAEVLAEDPQAITRYSDVEGLPELRERLAEIGRACGFARAADEILVTSGARQGIDLVARAVLEPGDVVAVESPTFAGTLASLQASGARVLPLPVDGEGADIDALERVLARHEVKLVALQSACQNPTGADLSPARRERLLELARARGFFVVDDGVYATVRYEGDELPRLRAGAPAHVIHLDSMSKTIGGGLRVGWIAASGPVLGRMVQLKLDSDIHSATLPQHVTARYLRGDRHRRLLARSLPGYRRRRDALLRALERHLADSATWTAPGGGHHVWVTLRRPTDERALSVAAARAGVAFLPGGAVRPEPSSRASLRLSFSLLAPDAIDEGVRRLAVAVREVGRSQRTTATGALS